MFLFEATRRVSRARTVSLDGRIYEVEAGMNGAKVTLRYDPAAPPEPPDQGGARGQVRAGVARLLDLHANARIKRSAEATDRDLPGACPRQKEGGLTMYLSHFGLRNYPFEKTLKLRRTSRHREHRPRHVPASAHLIELRGIGLLTGEAGRRQDRGLADR